MTTRTIHTLDARDNTFLEVLKDYFKLDEKNLHNEINTMADDLSNALEKKIINYQELRSALTPSNKRNEIALVFDVLQIDDSWYGLPVMTVILPLFTDRQSSHSVLVGNFVGESHQASLLKSTFLQHIKSVKEINYQNHRQFYIVYINNLSDGMVETITTGLNSFTPYVGFFDLTYSSFIKTYLSTILVGLFVKYKSIIIQGHEDDVENDKDTNVSGYPFEKYNFKCRSVQSMYYNLFLTYKIERQVFLGFESDTSFAINSLTSTVLNISDFKIYITQDKLEYVNNHHNRGKIKKAGIVNMTTTEFEDLIREKINNNYIYNLRLKEDSVTSIQFNIIIEVKCEEENKPIKMLVGLEYLPLRKQLKVITVY